MENTKPPDPKLEQKREDLETKAKNLFPDQRVFIVILSVLVIVLLLGLLLLFKNYFQVIKRDLVPPGLLGLEVKKFASEQEFKDFLQKAPTDSSFNLPSIGIGRGMEERITADLPNALQAPTADSKVTPDRISETNVQVLGIDEPDILKTDGNQIYYSSQSFGFLPFQGRVSIPERDIIDTESDIIKPVSEGKTRIINALPPTQVSEAASIDKIGDLLLSNNILAVFTYDSLIGYDVSDPQKPTQKWKLDIKQNDQIVTSRLYQDKIYLVTQSSINSGRPCPIVPLSSGASEISIPCDQIYHPISPTPVNVTYSALMIDIKTGETLDKVAFVGSSFASVVYVSKQNLYLTYTKSPDLTKYLYRFYLEDGKDLISAEDLKKLETLQNLDISLQAKLTELQVILQRYEASLSDDERLKLQNEMQNRLNNYSKKYIRELESTGIVKIALDNLDVESTSSVPGTPLNQFSLDEYQDNLRIATTIGGRMFGSSESVNDVYILDSNLKQLGSVQDLGVGERIYSARFIEDKGYVVTFKQIDPFYVLDLSDPKNPAKKGELKIPGFSSYLHPITKDQILGVGQEASQVKLSLFDVSNTQSPTEIDKYNLDEFWTEVQSNHHAFLLDDKFKIFFLPGGRGGYIFSYEGGKLALKKAVTGISAKRALFINDYLYIVGDEGLKVFNETDFSEVKNLTF